MTDIDLDKIASSLSEIVSTLCVRRSISSSRKDYALKNYVHSIAHLYERHAYLPQVYPAFAVNYNYYAREVYNSLSGSLSSLYEALGDLIREDLELDNPLRLIQLTLTGTVVLCVEVSQGYAPSVEFNIGGIKVSVYGYCSLMRHAHRSILMLASNTFMDYALAFMLEALSSFIDKTESSACQGCRDKIRQMGSLKGLWRFRNTCPECYEAFRRELTSRIMTAYRGYLASLYSVKWMYNSGALFGYELDGITLPLATGRGGRGVRANYSVLPTYLGRLIAQAIEVWSGRITDYDAFKGLFQVIREYLKIYTSFRREANRIKEIGKAVNIYRLNSVSEWHNNVHEIIQETPTLSLVIPTGLGEIVDDLVNYAVNEHVHKITAGYYAPEAKESFRWFNYIDFETLLTNRILRAR